MKGLYLLELFKEVFGENFIFSNFSDRLQMQKMVYLLQEKGLNVADFSFSWYKHGPYSQKLMNVMLGIGTTTNDFTHNFNSEEKEIIDNIKALFEKYSESQYSKENWVECVASLYYLKTRILSSTCDSKTIIEELFKRKQHLNVVESNELALECLRDF